MSDLDLDAIEARWKGYINVTDPHQTLLDATADIAALVDEVRELRKVAEAVTEFRRHTASLSTTNTDAATAAWDATTAALDALNAGGA